MQTNRTLNETVGGLQLIAGTANAVQEFDIRLWIETWAEPVMGQIVRLEQFYESNVTLLGLAGERAQLAEKFGIDRLDDELLEAEITIRINAGKLMVMNGLIYRGNPDDGLLIGVLQESRGQGRAGKWNRIPAQSSNQVRTAPASPLAQPLEIPWQGGLRRVGNRFTVQPMEGWDGELDGRPSELTRRRWLRFGRSGAKLVWGGEAVAVAEEAAEGTPAEEVAPEQPVEAASEEIPADETAAQPEGALKNFVNWIGNVVAPIAAGGAIFGAVVAFISGRTFGRWLLASAMLLAISGLTRLIEFWILQGVGGIS